MEFDFDSNVQQLEAEGRAAEAVSWDLVGNANSEAPSSNEAAIDVASESSEPKNQVEENQIEESQIEAELSGLSPLQYLLNQHLLWLNSGKNAGQQANLCHHIFSGSELTDGNLREALLNQSVLSGTDLLLADFQGASLMQADFRGANLLGAKFQDANLQGATLAGATGLQPENLAGANLFGAALSEDYSVSANLRGLGAFAKYCKVLVLGVILICVLAALRIFTTSDAQLLANSPVLPRMALQSALTIVPFYLCAPVALLGIYIGLHLCLQVLWDSAARQPAIFPDGRRLDTCLPWFARWPPRQGMHWLRENISSLASLEAALSVLLLYAFLPLTLVLFWARYLTLQDLRGTLLHVILITAAVFASLYFTRAAKRAYRPVVSVPVARTLWIRRSIAPALGLVLLLFSFGAIRGVPHNSAGKESAGMSSWASDLLWWAGYTPTAKLTDAQVSIPPERSGQQDDLAGVEGARLNGAHMRYMQADGAFFAKARLSDADLYHASFWEADLRQANLHRAILEDADLNHARLNRAILQEADLRKTNLTQADLQDANLSRASMSGALLVDAKLDGANLYGADLTGAVLKRASLQHADVRDANLENADLSMAILHQTYLSSAKMAGARLQNAQLAQAFLTQADLRNADLQGASLQGAILNGANLSGANLQNADFRGALGLTAAQICSAANVRQIQLDENLQHETQSLCD